MYTRIPNPETMRREIEASHVRSSDYGIDPNMICNPNQTRLTQEELENRKFRNMEFLAVATAQMEELCQLVEGAGFMMAVTDAEGYLLEMIGDQLMLQSLHERNCLPGYRWTEQDVGTAAISVALSRRIPIQLKDTDHYCKRGHGHTSSASPIFDEGGEVLGVLVMAGEIEQLHSHTLGMVLTAARAIEKQLIIIKASNELLLKNNSLSAILESIDRGVVAVDRRGVVTQINGVARTVLGIEGEVDGRHVDEFLNTDVDWNNVGRHGTSYADRELITRRQDKMLHLLQAAMPIIDAEGDIQGLIFSFTEINRVKKLINKLAGSQARFTFENIVGDSLAINEAKTMAKLAAQSTATVLLLGETGTGKELFAQAIHNASERKGQPFVVINCGAIPRELLESELFGYSDGAFTGARKGGRPGKFEMADGGTVFLDEIGDMPQDMQVKLLRVLQTAEIHRIGEHKPIPVDLRIIAATHVDLRQQVDQLGFREDLFYRLNVLPVTLPPLRQRDGDIVLLARHALAACGQILKRHGLHFSQEAEKILEEYGWPGNVRELGNVVERVANLATDNCIKAEHLAFLVSTTIRHVAPQAGRSLLQEVECQTIKDVLDSTGKNIANSARMLGITRATLYKKIQKYSLHR